MHLADAVDGYLLFKSSRAAPTTIRTDRVCLNQLLDWLGEPIDANDLTPDHVRRYLAYHRQRGLAAATTKRHYAVVSAMYSWLCSDDIGLAERDPTDAVDPPRLPEVQPKALSRETIEALLDAADDMTLHRRMRAIVLFLLDSACRSSELCGVDLSDVDLKTGRVLVTGKGSKERFVYLGSRARSAVWLYVSDERPEPAQVNANRLFLTIDGYPLDRHSLRHAIARLADHAGVSASPHAFRHCSAINHLRHGMSLVHLQHLMGHASIETTRRYLSSLADDDVQRVAMRTSPSDQWRL
jgi:integrase/recombinase XerD